MKIILLSLLCCAFLNVNAQQQTTFEGDPSHFYDWMQIGECPKALKNCDASNFTK